MRRWAKEIAVFWCLFLLAAPHARAQNTALGVRLGVNHGSASASDFGAGVASRTGFVGGVFASFVQAGRLVVQPEAGFSQKGFGSLVRGGTATVNLDYIEIPLLFKIRLSRDNRRLRPAFFLGPFVGFEVGCSLSGDVDEIGGAADCENLLSGRGEMDGGVVLGGGVDYGLVDRYFLTADIRYSHGLMNLDWEETRDRISTRTWSLMVGAGVLIGR